jgi:plasmid maintenance system antidote protein VapI
MGDHEPAAPADLIDDVVAVLAVKRVKRHAFAASVHLHPSYRGQILNGRRTLTPEVAVRIQEALKTLRSA